MSEQTSKKRDIRRIPWKSLHKLIKDMLTAVSCEEDVADTIADVYVDADLRGMGTQGLDHVQDLITEIQSGRINPNGRPRVVDSGPAYARVDGQSGPGQIAMVFSSDLAVSKARRAGCCVTGIVNCGDIFMIGYYAERVARQGLVALVATDSAAFVHPFGGRERMIGTNPLAIAIPAADSDPFLLDIATSRMSVSHAR